MELELKYQDCSKWATACNGKLWTYRQFRVCAKELLEPMRPLVTSLQGELVEVYFGFNKIEEVNLSYIDIRNGIDKSFQQMYTDVLELAEKVGSTEQRPRVCGRQTQRNNYPSEYVAEYWKRTVAISFLDVICSEMKSRFSEEKRAHYELCALIPKVIVKQSSAEVEKLGERLLVKVESRYAAFTSI